MVHRIVCRSHLSDKVFLLVPKLAPLCRRAAEPRVPAGPVGHWRPGGGVVRVADRVHVEAAGDARKDVGLAR